MITISLCMIVRDEEDTIARCLETIKDLVDEIIIVDTGSIDKTKAIANQYTPHIYDFEWIYDFSAARNFSFSKATQEYLLWLDADDVLLAEDRNKLKYLKEQLDPSIDVVMMKYNLDTDGVGRSLCTYYRERLLKRSQNYLWNDPIHEYIEPVGKIMRAEIAVTHKKVRQDPAANLNIFAKMLQNGRELSHRNCFYYARELHINERYDDAIEWYEKFLSQDGGFFSNYLNACLDLSRLYTAKGDRKKSVKTLFHCFEFGVPRAEICCELGRQYQELGELERAIAWFDIATKLNKPENTIGIVIHDCYNFLPYAAMSICYCKLGLIEKAIEYNELAAKFRPDSETVVNNRNCYEALIKADQDS